MEREIESKLGNAELHNFSFYIKLAFDMLPLAKMVRNDEQLLTVKLNRFSKRRTLQLNATVLKYRRSPKLFWLY